MRLSPATFKPLLPKRLRALRRGRGLVALTLTMLLGLSALMLVVYAGNAKDFISNTAMTSAGNYSPSGAPTNADDVRINRTSASLTMTTSSLTLESLSVDDGNTFSIRNATAGATNSTLNIGNNAGFTNNFSTVSNDLVYLTGNSTLTIQGPNTDGGTGVLNLALQSSGNFNIGTASILTISSVISGSGKSITKTSGGTATLSGANTYTGGLTLSAGTQNLNNAAAPGTGTLTISSATIDNTSGAAIGPFTNNNAQTWDGDFTFTGGTGTTHDLNFGTGAVSLGTTAGTTRTITASAGTLTVGGIISNGTTANSLTKAGAGTLTLSGANAYTGTTTVGAGTLKLIGTSTTANTTISIAGGATFDVSGLTTPPLALASSQTLNGTGTASTGTINGSLTMGSTSPLTLSYLSTNAAGTLTVTNGILTLQSGETVTVTNNGTALAVGDYKLISKGAGGAVSGTPTTVVVNGTGGLAAGALATLQTNAGELFLHVANTAPSITATPVSRQQGAGSSNSQIATVNDTESGAIAVTVTVTTANPANGVTVSNIVNTNGTVTANVVATCSATNASFTLQASDGSLTSTDTLNVTVTARANPSATYSDQSVAEAGSLSFSPTSLSSGCVDTTVTSVAIQSVGTFNGSISGIDSLTGAISVSDAKPAGGHTFTIRTTDSLGAFSDTTFQLEVTCPTITVSPATLPNSTVGAAYNNPVTASGGIAAYTYAVTSGTVPAGLTFNSDGTWSGTLTTANTYSFTITATDSYGCTGSRPYSVTVDPQPTISIAATVSQTEGDTSQANMSFAVNLSNASTQTITVHYATADGSTNPATGGGSCGGTTDYVTTTGTLTFNPGDTAGSIDVPICGDTTDEPDETFTVTLDTPTNSTISQGTSTGTITDNDAQPTISIDDVTHNEGDSSTTSYVFSVTLSNPSQGTITVDYTTQNDSAVEPGDYTLNTGTLNFAPGDTLKTITVLVNGDTTGEPDEVFFVNLNNTSSNSTLPANTKGTGTITNDDPSDLTINTSQSLPAGTYNDVTINNCGTVVTMTGNVVITGTLTVNNCATLDPNGFTVSGAGSFSLASGGKLLVHSANGITVEPSASGDIHTNTRSYSGGANYVYAGNTNQVVGDGLPASVANLVIANAGSSGNNTVTNLGSQIVTATLTVNSGIYSSHSDYVDVVINNAGTLSLAADITVSGNWTNNGTFTANGFKVTFDGAANQTIGGSNSTTFAALQVSNSGTSPANVVALDGSAGATATAASTLSVTSGVFDQGSGASSSNFTTVGSGTVATVAFGATWRNLGTGDLTLSGDVSNSGTINFNANGTTCGDNDDILIRSTGVARTWSGTGTFSMIDVDVKDQMVPLVPPPVAIFVNSGTNSTGNTGWVFVDQCTAGTYTWIGGPNQDWQVATNWNPTRAAPAAGDILIFDGNSTPAPIVSNVPTETDAALRLVNGVSGVTLNASVLGAQTLTLSGVSGSDLSVPTGTLLTLAGANGLTISLTGAGTQGSVGGQIILQGGPHRLIGANTGEISFASGSIFTVASSPAGFTGNPFGTGTADSVRFQSGSSAFFDAGGDPFGGGANVVTFNSGSTQTFNAASAFSANGRTYGNLTLDGSQTYFDSTATIQVTVFNDLTIQSGSTLKLSNSAGGDLNLLSNFTNSGSFDPNGRIVKFQGASTTQTVGGSVTFFDVVISKTGGSVKVGNTVIINGALSFNGTVDVLDIAGGDLTLNGTVGGTDASGALDSTVYGANLHIGGTGAVGPLRYLGTQNLTALDVNRTSGGSVTLATNLNIGNGASGGVTLTNGIVDMGANTLSLAAFPTVTRTNGYVIGNLQKSFGALGSFTFPVGTANAYSPLDANVTANTSGTLSVKAVQGQQPNISGPNALQRYWTLSGSGLTADLTFHYRGGAPTGGDVIGSEANYKVFKYDGSFTQVPNQSVNTVAHTATVIGVSSFSDWTLAEPAAALPDLAVTKIDSQDPVTEGNNLSYLITVTNNGAPATGVVLNDPLPANVTFVSSTASQGTCTGTATVNCTLGSIGTGASATVTIVLTPTNAAVNTTLSNTATATLTEADANNADNSATQTTQVVAAVCTAPPAGMISWYPGASNANDIYGPNNGALINGTGFATGKVGQAFSFDGNDDRVEVNPPGTLNITGNKLTMDGWIKPVANTNSFYFGRSAPSDHPYLLFFSTGSNSIHLVTRTNPGSQIESDTLYAPPVGTWTHIAMVYDGATTKLYANAVEVFSAAQTGNLDSSSLPFIIGNRAGSAPNSSFNGLIDEVEVFDQALSAGQIAALYNTSSAGKCHDSTLQFSSATYAVNENVGGGNATITVTRTGAHDTSVGVSYATVPGGSATAGASCTGTTDYITSSNTLSFAANETSKTFDVPICNDTTFEPDETVNLQLSNASGTGASLGGQTTSTLTITSDDAQPAISIANVSEAEGNSGPSNFVFNVTLSNPSSTDVVINYSTADGTTNPANAPGDYTATSGMLTIPADSTTGTITVPVNGDTTVEADETFFVNLTGATGATILINQGLGTITNDDTDVSVAVSPSAVDEDGATNLVYTFTRNGVTSGALTVNFSVAGTATFGTDYAQSGADTFNSTTGTVTFGAGNSTAAVTIDPTTDSIYEAPETVILTVDSGTGYNVSSPSAATGTITNDDPIPTVLVVNKTADTDDGYCTVDDCSLREAISNANTNPDANTINFNIPISDPNRNGTTGVFTISPGTALPTITNPVTIDGYSQTPCSGNPAPCSQPNTQPTGSDAVLLIEIDGTNAGGYGLRLSASNSTIKGLVINRSGQSEIEVTGATDVITGNFLGTDAAGTADLGSTVRSGVEINGTNGNTIGGANPADRNVISGSNGWGIFLINGASGNTVQNNYIGTDKSGTLDRGNVENGVLIDNRNNNTIRGNLISGNDADGILIRNNSAGGTANVIQGNFIGTKADGTTALGNGGDGIEDQRTIAGSSDGNTIGGTGVGAANVIAFNGGDGVFVNSSDPAFISGTSIRGNSIHSNSGLGIDLSPDGVTANDSGDGDAGANKLQNFPIIASALVGGTDAINGTLNSTPGQTFTIDLYDNPTCNGSGNGEGKVYLGSTTTTTTDANGDATFSFVTTAVTANDFITATATDSSGNTSEFSGCRQARTYAAGTIEFAQGNTDSFETNSGTHTVDISVNRTGGSDGAVSVNWAVTDGTATTADNDYSISPSSGTFNWADGDSSSRTITISVNGDTKFELDETVTLTLSQATGLLVGLGTNPATLTIKNDDTEPTISINDVTHNEGAAGTTSYIFTVSLSNASYLPINVNYATADDTATAPTDYTAVATTAVPTFAPNETSKQVTVLVNGDDTFETTEQFFVNLTSPSNATISDNQGVGTITNDDPVPTISINDVTQTEGNGPGSTNFDFTVSLTNPSYLPIAVDYVTSDGTASSLSDYNAIPTTQLTFDPGQTSKTISVQVNGDFAFENSETFFVDLANPSNVTMGDSHGVGTITNDDTPPELSINDRSLNEGTTPGPTTPFTFTVTRTVADATSSVNFTTANGSSNPATGGGSCGAGVDYVSQSGTLNFPATGPGSTSQTITVLVCKDAVFEPNETFVINLSGAVDATITDSQGVGTILNDDVPGSGFLVNTTDDIDDGNCNVAHCSLREAINATNTALTAVAINFAIPANDPRHFYYANDGVSGQVTLANVTATIASDDTTIVGIDPDWPHSWWSIQPTSVLGQLPAITKQVFVDGYSQTGTTVNTLTSGDNAVLRIELDGESAGLVVQGLSLNAGVSTARGLVINRFKFDAGDSNPTGVGLRVAGTGSTLTGNFIGTDVSGTLDLGNEGSGLYVTGSSATIGGNTPDVFNLISGNNIDGVLFSNSNSNVIQGNLVGTKTNGASPLGNSGNGITLKGGGSVFNTIGGAGSGEGNTVSFNGLTGGDGVNVATAGIGNSIRGNSIFSNGSGASDLGIDLDVDGPTANDTKDLDSGPNNLQNFPLITSALVTGSTRTITGTLNSATGQTFDIDFYVSSSCDASGNGEGQTYLGSTSVTTDGTTGDASFTFHPNVNATAMTAGKAITATATSTGASFNTSEFSACFTVIDGSPGAGDIQFTSATYSVAENVAGQTVGITLTRVGGSNGSISAQFNTTNGSATAGSDYTNASQTVTFGEGETSKTINVTIIDDSIYEGNETVNLSLGASNINAAQPDGGASVVADPHAAVLTITENDPAPSFTIDDVTHVEGNSGTTTYQFTVTKTGSTALNAGVSYQTQNSTATTADNDYQTSSGTLSFLPSDTTKNITVLVNGDTIVEPNEAFFVNLTSPTNATISDNQGLGTITNDDTDVSVAVSPLSVAEDGAPNLVYTFTRTGVTSGALTVNFSVGGGAAFGADYTQTGAASFTATTGTVTFGAGNSTATVTVDPTSDSTVEGDETVVLTVTSGTGYNVGSPSAATGTVNNDDTDVTIGVSPASVSEDGVANLVYTFSRTGVTSNTLTVNFSVGGTATFATDYTQSGGATFGAASGTVTFGAGNSTATVTIDPTPDISFEPNETVVLTVTSGTGYTAGSPSAATGTINNDDAAGGIIQFTANNYATTENSRKVTITVQRLGDTSGPVTVNYATPDNSEATVVSPCSANISGIASPRCDFTTALGTIRFADADNAPKTFDILISQDSYVEPPENLTITLSNLTGSAVFGVNSTAMVTIADDDFSAPTTNPIDDATNFVRQHYHDFLNREPDQSGLDFWTNEITSCGSNQQCIDFKRVQVSAAFYLSIEFQDTGYLVERFYKSSYGDVNGSSTFGGAHQLPVPVVRFSEFLGDTQEIGQGVIVGATGWPQALENNKAAFADKFVQRARFVAAFPLSMTPAQFVDKLNLNAGNPLSQAERDQLVAGLASSAKTRAQVLRAVAEDQDLKDSEFNRAFVLMQYFGYLRRNANVAPDSDYSGYDFWLTKLNQFNGNFQNADMVKAFITSSEYRGRSGP